MKKITKLAASFAALVTMAGEANAAVTITFEGVGNLNEVGNYYDGGAGGSLGIAFSQGSLALVDVDAGGSGNTANEPSGQTTLVFLNANSAILNYAAGFDTGFSFFYSSNSAAAAVNVYDGLNATGNLLGSISLSRQFNTGCAGDPDGLYCNWTAAGVGFAGIAKSIDFGGTANFIVYDNITFGAINPGGGAVPEPATWAMLITGFGMVGAGMRRRQTSARVTYA